LETAGLVSILMNCLNGEAYVAEAIDSVLLQTYQHWEIIFWDNCSTDQTPEIVKGYKDQRIKYFRGTEVVPLYSARNLALKNVSGEFIAFLDIDDKWMPEKLEKQVPLFSNSRVGLVFSDTYFFDQSGITFQLYKHKPYYTSKCFRRLLDSYFLSLETVVVRRKALYQQATYFDERFNMCGDYDLFTRIGYSWELDMINEPLGMWRVDRKSLSWSQTNKFFEETELMLQKFKTIYPDFETEYHEEIKKVRLNLKIGRAKVLLREGKNAEAKKILAPIFWRLQIKTKILYLISVLPSILTEKWCSKRF
jgi:glycosyltransferase involved in cell wall biosynthesis